MKYRLLLCLLFCFFSMSARQAADAKELQKKRLAIINEIEKTNRLLKETNLTISNALNHLNLLGQQIDSRKKVIYLLNQEIDSLSAEIRVKEIQIQILEKDLEAKKRMYSASIKKVYLQNKNQNYLLFILSSQSFVQSFHRIIYLKIYSNGQKKQAIEIAEKQKLINREKNLLVTRRSNEYILLNTRLLEENQLSKEEKIKRVEIENLEKNKKKLQVDLAAKEKQADALNLQIEKFIDEEIRKSTKTIMPQRGIQRTSNESGNYVMNENEKILSSSFSANKGKLPFPLNGNYKVVGYFGMHQHKELSRIVTRNNGINIETNAGNEARTVFDGIVSCIFTFPGYNNSIIIRHGNYLTLYSNIEQVYVKQGDKVKTGQAIGKIYTDKDKGNSTLLHFEIWKEQTKLNPLSWIK